MIDIMFYVPIYHVAVNDWNRKKEILLSFIDHNKLIKPADSNRDEHITTDYHNTDNNKIHLIENTLKVDLDEFAKAADTKTSIHSYWFEKADIHEYHPSHNHGMGLYSAVLYLEYDKDLHTPVEFISPFLNLVNGKHLHYIPQDVQEGSLLVFPSAINHFTHPNKSLKPRTVLAFNLNIHE